MSTPKRGEIYKIDIPESETRGSEFHGSHWYVIMSRPEAADYFGVVMAVPLTSPESKTTGAAKDAGPFRLFRIKIPESEKTLAPWEHGLKGDSLALTYQVRPIALMRLMNVPCSGRLTPVAVNSIEGGLAYSLKMPPPGIPPSATINTVSKAVSTEPAKPVPGRPTLLERAKPLLDVGKPRKEQS